MSDVPVQTSAGSGSQLELALSSFAAGEYLLELTAKSEAGSAQEFIAFRIR
jgi:hypothetical protein